MVANAKNATIPGPCPATSDEIDQPRYSSATKCNRTMSERAASAIKVRSILFSNGTKTGWPFHCGKKITGTIMQAGYLIATTVVSNKPSVPIANQKRLKCGANRYTKT